MTKPPGDSMDSLLGRLVRTRGADDDPTTLLKEGDTVGRYRIRRPLGAGGMGVVFLATDESLQRDVALKLVAPSQRAPASRERLLREARAAASLSHPNIVTIFDVGEEDGCVFLAMEFIEGTTLREKIGVSRWSEAVDWLVAVARALGAAHGAGLVHRDIKPDNVLLGADGQVKVLDFGIARQAATDPDAPQLTGTDAIVGTPQYMAPEQLASKELDGRADQFAWAVTAYELLGGERPWSGMTSILSIYDAMRTLPPPLPGVPEIVSSVIRKALSFEPEMRFSGFGEIIRAWEPLVATGAHTASRASDARPFDSRSALLLARLSTGGTSQVGSERDALLAAFVEELAAHVERFEGRSEIGDDGQLRGTFSSEDAAEGNVERAARAAIAMESSVGQLRDAMQRGDDGELALSAAIATGETPDAASSTAEGLLDAPGIVVAPSAHPYLARRFRCSDLGDRLRVDGLVPSNLSSEMRSELVGREPELEALADSIAQLRKGRGAVVAVLGEAGSGKTRLLEELRRRHGEDLRWFVGQSYAHTQTRSYGPLIGILRGVFQISAEEPEIVARAKLRAGLRSFLDDEVEEHFGPMAHLLGIADQHGARPPPAALGPQLAVALRALLGALPPDQPTILVFEDLHAADRASIELLTALAELPETRPILLILTAQPIDDAISWDLLFHVQRNFRHRYREVSLRLLGPGETDALVCNMLGARSIPQRLSAHVRERSEGNPLFAGEIVRMLVEQRALSRHGDGWSLSEADRSAAISVTVRGIIASRINRLPAQARELLQLASVIGREFSRRMLAQLNVGEDPEPAIARLVKAGLIDEQARIPEALYRFRHALAHEVTYDGLDPDRRRALHARVAELLSEQAGGSDRAPELARHFEGAGYWTEGLRHRLAAAQSAASDPEAVSHYWRALEIIDRIDDGTVEDTRVDTVLSLMGLPGWIRDQKAKERGLGHLHRAIDTATRRGESGKLARLEALSGYLARDEEQMRAAVERARASGDAMATAHSASKLGDYLGSKGKYGEAVSFLDESIRLHGQEGRRHDQAMTMVIGGRCYSARSGRLDKAMEYAARGRHVGEELGDARLRAWRAMECEPLMYLGRWQQAVEIGEEAIPIAWKVGTRSPIMFGSAWLAIAYLHTDRADDAEPLLSRAISEAEARGITFPLVYLKIASSRWNLVRGELEAAKRDAEQAVALGASYPLDRGAAHRVQGEIEAAMSQPERAEAAFRQSLEILERIDARPELAQTLLSFGRFDVKRDRPAGAAHLERACEIFAEIGADWWLEQARAALPG